MKAMFAALRKLPAETNFTLFDNYEQNFIVVCRNRKDNNMTILIRLYFIEEGSYISRWIFVMGLSNSCILIMVSSALAVSQMHEGNGESAPDMVEEGRLV